MESVRLNKKWKVESGKCWAEKKWKVESVEPKKMKVESVDAIQT